MRLGSPSKRARTNSNAAALAAAQPEADPAIVSRFKQPEHLLGPAICALCERNISKSVKVLFADTKPDLITCLECLRTGKTSVDFPEHHADQDYYIFDNLEFPLLC